MVDSGNLQLALISAGVFGFRHGLDYDHIAAITDISSVQARARDAMRFGLLYVSGHATTVAVLGALAIAFRVSGFCRGCVPDHVASGERSMGRTAGWNYIAYARPLRLRNVLSSIDAQSWSAHANHAAGQRRAVDLLAA